MEYGVCVHSLEVSGSSHDNRYLLSTWQMCTRSRCMLMLDKGGDRGLENIRKGGGRIFFQKGQNCISRALMEIWAFVWLP